ncbi:MAG TPA: hypothetical protein VIV35_08170 [Chitinophagaceae bacterium]
MQKTRIVQAVVLMMIVALAASCAATKEYSSKLFSPRNESTKDNGATALRFLELDSLQSEKDGWVSTDIIMGRDTGSKTVALDKLAKVFPPVSVVKDTAATSKEDQPSGPSGKTTPVIVETKPIPAADLPVAKNYDPTEVRNKKTRD